MKQKYLPVLLGLALGCPAFSKTVPTNAAADLVLGQADFVTGSVAPVRSSFSLRAPSGVVVDPVTRKVFVADQLGHRVLRYPNVASLGNGAGAEAVFGQPRFSTTSSGSGDTGMNDPHGLFFDRKGRLWVSDTGNNRVLMFEAASFRDSQTFPDLVFGQPNFTTNGSGTTAALFNRPDTVWVDNSDRLWVVEEGNNRVLRFDSISTKASGASADGVLGQINFTSGGAGSGSSGLQSPTGLAVSAAGTLFVSCFNGNRVMVFPNAATLGNGAGASVVLGQADFTTTTAGTSATTLDNPCGVFITPDDTLWVCEFANSRVLRFDKASTKTSGAVANAVVGQPNFTSNTGTLTNRGIQAPFLQVFADINGDLWVPDRDHGRVLRFPADVTKPLLVVTPAIAATTTKSKVTIKGTASDAFGISSVQYQIGTGALKIATGTTGWQFTAPLVAGKNKITIFAVDSVGNLSISKVIKIKRTSSAAPFSVAAIK